MGRRLRGNGRGKKIYWRSPAFYFDNLSSTPITGRLKYLSPSVDDYVFQNQTWAFRSPLNIDGFAFGSDLETANCTYVIYIDKNGSLAYQSDGFSDSLLTANEMKDFPLRAGTKVKFLKGDVYSIRAEDIQDRTTEVYVYIYGHYYIFDNQVNYESTLMSRNDIGDASFLLALNPRMNSDATKLLFEDYNSVYINKVGINRTLTDAATVTVEIYITPAGITADSEFTVALDTTLDQQIFTLFPGVWIKPGYAFQIRTGVSRTSPTEETLGVRMFGYRRETNGKYRFCENTEFVSASVGSTTIDIPTQQQLSRPGFDYLVTWPIADIESLNLCAGGGGLADINTRLTINGTQKSDFQTGALLAGTERNFEFNRTNAYSGRYNSRYQGIGIEGKDANNLSDTLIARVLQKVCF